MPMYNLLEYSNGCCMTSGNLWNYYRDEVKDSADENNDANNFRMNNNETTKCKYFEYKSKLIWRTPNNSGRADTEVVVLLKYLSNFWRTLDLPLINCEIELSLSWSRYCVMSEISTVSRAVPNTDPVRYEVATTINSATFQINNAKLYVPVVTLSINNNLNFLENTERGFKRTSSWNNCRSEITIQSKNNNLDYLIVPTFRNIDRLFVLLFKNGNIVPTRDLFRKYYILLVEIKDFNALIYNKLFLISQ